MDYIFKIGEGLNFGVKSGQNVAFGVTAGSSGTTVLPDNVVTSDTIKYIETVTKQQYNSINREKNTLYIVED